MSLEIAYGLTLTGAIAATALLLGVEYWWIWAGAFGAGYFLPDVLEMAR